MSKEDLLNALNAEPPIMEATCPICKETFSRDGEGHSFDAIFEFGKCEDCLGYCPYCKPELHKLNEKYHQINGQCCPYCDSDDIEYASERGVSPHQKDTYMQQQLVSCRTCGKWWREHLELVFIEPAEEGEDI